MNESGRYSVTQGIEQACKMIVGECDKQEDRELCAGLKAKLNSRPMQIGAAETKPAERKSTARIEIPDIIVGDWKFLGGSFTSTKDYRTLVKVSPFLSFFEHQT